MKKFSQFINEKREKPIDDQWLNDDKPVQTLDGRQAIVVEIDRSEVPNIIKGKVKEGEDLFEYEWDENGNCLKALDKRGNPKAPSENDNLVKYMG